MFNTWNDQWPFTAAGIPSAQFEASGGGDCPKRYHSNFSTLDQVDWKYHENITEVIIHTVMSVDQPLLAFDFRVTCAQLESLLKPATLLELGVKSDVVSNLLTSLHRYGEAANGIWNTRELSSTDAGELNRRLMLCSQVLNSALNAISPREDAAIYPHEQVLLNVLEIKMALVALQKEIPDQKAALKALAAVDETGICVEFSPEVYQFMVARKSPGFRDLQMGELGHLTPSADVVPEYRRVENGDIQAAIRGLERKMHSCMQELELRLDTIAVTLNKAAAILQSK